MSLTTKVIVAVSPADNIESLLSPLREMNLPSTTEIHFVNVFALVTYSYWMSNAPLVFPIESDRKEIEASTVKKLTEIGHHVLTENFKGKIIAKCLFGESTKSTFAEYVNKENASLVVVAKRAKRGLFESSFAQFVNTHTKANLLLLKEI